MKIKNMAVWLAWQSGRGEKRKLYEIKNDKKPLPRQPECQKILMS